MAITKIHQIKSTLSFAIDYITNADKMDEKLLVSSYLCHPISAHTAFIKTREDANTSAQFLPDILVNPFIQVKQRQIKLIKLAWSFVKKY